MKILRLITNKIKVYAKTDFVKVFSLSAVSTFVKIISRFVSIKVVSVIIGPSGVAMLGQLSNFTNILLKIATGGNNSGVTKYLASNKGNEDKIKTIIGTSMMISFYLSLFCSVILIVFSSYFSNLILNDSGQEKYKSIFIIFGVTIFLYALNSKLLAILNGFRQYRKYILVDITSSTVGLIFSVGLVFYWNVYGALLAAVTYQSIVVFISLFFVLKAPWFKWHFIFRGFDIKMAKKLSLYSIMTIISAMTVPISQILVRGRISNSLSLNDAGIWEGMTKISSLNLMVISTSMGIYYLPKLSGITDAIGIKKEIFKTAKLLLPFVFFTSLSIYFLRDFIILLVFSNKFKSMSDLFAFQLLGDFFKIISWLLAYLMLAKTMTKTYVYTEIFSNLGWVLLSYLLISYYGYKGASIAYAINYFIYVLVMFFIFRKLLFNKNPSL